MHDEGLCVSFLSFCLCLCKDAHAYLYAYSEVTHDGTAGLGGNLRAEVGVRGRGRGLAS